MSNHKMKGLLKGLRYISNIFENDTKEPEMQIGFPTDVKHVAHIGWDGPSVNSPSWMNEFKSSELGDDASIKSEDSSSRRNARDPELPKSTRRHASTGAPADEPNRERSEKSRSRRSKNSNKDLSESTKSKNASGGGGGGGGSGIGGDIPKKSRRKKSKDSAEGSSRSSRTSRREALKLDSGELGMESKSNNNNHSGSQSSDINPFEEGHEQEHTRIS